MGEHVKHVLPGGEAGQERPSEPGGEGLLKSQGKAIDMFPAHAERVLGLRDNMAS